MDMVAVSRLNAQRHMRTKTHVWKAAQRMQRVSVAMAGVGLSVSARVRMVVYHDGTEYGMHCTVLELDIDK